MTPPPRSRPRTIRYLAETDAAARDGAAALEDLPSGPERTVQPLAIDEIGRLEEGTADADCVVFAETPTTAAGATLLEVVETCGTTPLVLFTDADYAPRAARSTDGIDGYVRRDTDDAVAHLADEIEWVCGGAEIESKTNGASGTEPEGEEEAIELTGTTHADRTRRLLESVPELTACRDRERLFILLVDRAADAIGCEYCWLSTVYFGELTPRATAPGVAADDLDSLSRNEAIDEALRTGEPLRIDDLASDDRLDAPLEGLASMCCVPVGDVGVLSVAAEHADGFDEDDCALLAAWCRIAAGVLERLETDASHRNEHERLRRERDRLQATVERLGDERDRLAAERDRFRSLFANVPEPAIRYEIEDGRPIVRGVNDTYTAVFGTDRETVVDSPVGEGIVPSGFEQRRRTLCEALRAGERRQLEGRRETVDGVREFRLTVVPLERSGIGTGTEPGSDDRNPEGLIVYSDVTEANRRARELAAAENRLETIGDRLATDVRTPLNVARGYLELAAETGDAAHFAEVDAAQEELRERVEQLVAIARRDAVLVDTEPVAVHDVARRAWIAVDTGDARLVTDPAADRVLEGDKTRLRELFEHLLRAALEGLEGEDEGGADGTESPVVTVGATDDGFVVTGRRSAADADATGQPTPVSGNLGAADGTGFGLDPVERIADAHGWDVGVAEDEDGTSFVFRGVDGN